MNKKLSTVFLIFAAFLFSIQSWGQAWNLTPTMTATLDYDHVLTISTSNFSEAMPDYALIPNTGNTNAPWGLSWILSVVIENNVTSIGNQAFERCSLASVAFPNSLTSIGTLAFYGCYNLVSASIPSSVKSIGLSAFGGCSKLTSIAVDAKNPAYSSDADGILYNKEKTTLLTYPCGKSGAFTIPNSVSTIGECAFYDHETLTVVTIPNSIKTILWAAFQHCIGLTSISIPNSVTDIESSVFYACTSLTNVTVDWATPLSVPADIFAQVNTSSATLHVPKGTRALYQNADVWKTFGTIIDDGNPPVMVIPNETQPVAQGGKGTIALNLSVPSNVTLTGSFEVQFPDGMTLDEELTALSAGFSDNSNLVFTYEENNKWLIEIKSSALRSSTEDEVTKIMDIVYQVNDTVHTGSYEVTIANLDFNLDTGTSIKEDSISVNINVIRWATSINEIHANLMYAYITNNILKVESPQSEKITIYSASGVLLYSAMKSAGEMDIPVSSLRGSVYIIKGSVSGTIKVTK